MDTPADTATPDGTGTSPDVFAPLIGDVSGSALPGSPTDGTASRRGSRKANGPADSALPSLPADAAPVRGSDAEQAQEQQDVPGWWRNTSGVPLTVQPDGAPSALLEHGEAAYLPRDPGFPGLEPCDRPEPEPPSVSASEGGAEATGQESAR